MEPNLKEREIPIQLKGDGRMSTNLLSKLQARTLNDNQESPLPDPQEPLSTNMEQINDGGDGVEVQPAGDDIQVQVGVEDQASKEI